MLIENTTLNDFIQQLRNYLPVNWFSNAAVTPGGNTYALLKAEATSEKVINDDLIIVQNQISLVTATGDQIDAIARDFFGNTLPRLPSESDASYRARIVSRLFLRAGTRQAMYDGITAAVQTPPVIRERKGLIAGGGWMQTYPIVRNFGPIGWDTGTALYGIDLGPYQALIDVQQPEPTSDHFLTFSQIMALIQAIKPIATTMWVKITGPASTGGIPIM